MYIYIFSLLYILVIGIIFVGILKLKNKKILVAITSLPIFILIGFRHSSIGVDTRVYLEYYFMPAISSNLEILFERKKGIEYGFELYLKGLTFISNDPIILIISSALVVTICVSYFIYKHSSNPIISFYLFMTLGFLVFSLSGIRQSLALAFILISYTFIVERKLFKFLLMVGLAASFHTSALIFTPAYFIARRKLTVVNNIYLILAVGTIILAGESILELISTYSNYNLDSSGALGGHVITAFLIIILIVGILNKDKILNRSYNNLILYNMLIMTILLWFLRYSNQIVERSSYYYYIFLIAFIPEIIYTFKNSYLRSIMYLLIIVLTTILFLARLTGNTSVTPYKFF